jgi:hypothetical protein
MVRGFAHPLFRRSVDLCGLKAGPFPLLAREERGARGLILAASVGAPPSFSPLLRKGEDVLSSFGV